MEAWACEAFKVAHLHGCFWVAVVCNGIGGCWDDGSEKAESQQQLVSIAEVPVQAI